MAAEYDEGLDEFEANAAVTINSGRRNAHVCMDSCDPVKVVEWCNGDHERHALKVLNLLSSGGDGAYGNSLKRKAPQVRAQAFMLHKL